MSTVNEKKFMSHIDCLALLIDFLIVTLFSKSFFEEIRHTFLLEITNGLKSSLAVFNKAIIKQIRWTTLLEITNLPESSVVNI